MGNFFFYLGVYLFNHAEIEEEDLVDDIDMVTMAICQVGVTKALCYSHCERK